MAARVETNAESPLRSHRMLEISGIALFVVGTYWIGYILWLEAHAYGSVELAILIGTFLFAGWFLSDMASGIVHWLGDTFGTVEMPVLGKAFIEPFRHHHVEPKAITQHDFIETNGNNCIVVCACLYLPMLSLYALDEGPLRFWLMGTGATLGFATFMTNQIHKWAHLDSPPWYARLFQKLGLFMTTEHHDVHHAAPYDTYYCITSGWLNPIFEKTKFFERAERVIRAILARLS